MARFQPIIVFLRLVLPDFSYSRPFSFWAVYYLFLSFHSVYLLASGSNFKICLPLVVDIELQQTHLLVHLLYFCLLKLNFICLLCDHVHTIASVWMSGDNLLGLVLSFQHVSPGNRTQVRRCLCLPSHLMSPGCV